METKTAAALAASILAAGLAAAAVLLGGQFKNLRQPGVITVKGLAEAEHQASLGTWRVGIKAWGKDYAEAIRENEKNLPVLKAFLQQQGFQAAELEEEDLSVSVHSEDYTDKNGVPQTRDNGHDAVQDIVISTKDLDKLQKAAAAIQQLRAENDTISFGSPHYYLENLENIKRELIARATQDAFVRAEEFAKTGRSKVGAMTSASQGSFDIRAAAPSSDTDSDYGGSYDTSSVQKKVRLVVTIQYAIE